MRVIKKHEREIPVLGNIRLVIVFLLVGIMLIVLLPFQLVALILAKFGWPKLAGQVPVLFHKGLLFIIGIRLTVKGTLSRERPLLVVANHVSWLDIVVMGAVAPLSFVAKAEMSTWPLFGQLAILQRTVFVRREERRASGQQANQIADRMAAKEIMVLFPEGTTSDGNSLLPFKTPLFEAAKIALKASSVDEAAVQPTAIDYNRLHGMPLGRGLRPHVAWPGDIGLVESLIPLVKEGALDVTVHLGTPIKLTAQSNRKIIAKQAASSIRQMLQN